MNNKKNLVIAISAMIIILVIAIVLIIKLVSINNNKGNEIVEVNNNIEIDNKDPEENAIENSVNEEVNNVENNESQTGTEVNGGTNQNTPVADPEQEVDKETIQKQETDKEKAINIAKKDWGTDNSVYFSYEGTSNGKSIVSVRSNDTTRALRYYYINVNNGSFDIEE